MEAIFITLALLNLFFAVIGTVVVITTDDRNARIHWAMCAVLNGIAFVLWVVFTNLFGGN